MMMETMPTSCFRFVVVIIFWRCVMCTGEHVQFNNPHMLNSKNKHTAATASRGSASATASLPEAMAAAAKSEAATRLLEENFFAGEKVSNLADHLRRMLEQVARHELGVRAMQDVYDQLSYQPVKRDGQADLDKLHKKLQIRLFKYQNIINNMLSSIRLLYGMHLKRSVSPRFDCCNMASTDLTWAPSYACPVSQSTSCDLFPSILDEKAFNPGRNLTSHFLHVIKFWPHVKWQYFMSSEGLHTEFPAHNFQVALSESVRYYRQALHNSADAISPPSMECSRLHLRRHRDMFVRAVHPARMHVVIVLDNSQMSERLFSLGKQVVLTLLDSLSEKDMVSVFAAANTISFPVDGCSTMFPVTQDAKRRLTEFVQQLALMSPHRCNHTRALDQAFDVISKGLSSLDPNESLLNQSTLLAYVSRGSVQSMEEMITVLKRVSIRQARLHDHVVINAYQLVERGHTPLWENSFLDLLARQWTKYDNRDDASQVHIRKGHHVKISAGGATDLQKVGDFYRVFNLTKEPTVQYSLPYSDLEGRGLVMSMAAPVLYREKAIGVFGMDLHMAQMVDLVTYFHKDRHAYAFMVHHEGYTVMHPALQRPITVHARNAIPMHTDIRHFEKYPGFNNIRSRLLSESNGTEELLVRVRVSVGGAGDSLSLNSSNASEMSEEEFVFSNGPPFRGSAEPFSDHFRVIYHWRRLENSPFIVVVKTLHEGRTEEERELSKITSPFSEFHYHRLDLAKYQGACRYLRQLSTFETSTVFLSARSFWNPFDYLKGDEGRHQVTNLITYLTDSTRVISSPGIKSEVRSDVAAVGKINRFWLDRHAKSPRRDYIVRRYVATSSGVLRMFPGTLMSSSFDPTTREWYQRALQFPGQVVVTPPYLDAGGAGYIVTLSVTIHEARTSQNGGGTSAQGRVLAVMGLDLTYKSLYIWLHKELPLCRQSSLRCFLLEDSGYLVAHPQFVAPSYNGPSEANHVTHREPLIANDLLNQQQFSGFMRKTLCNSYNSRTIQRVYSLNISITGPLTSDNGHDCARYQILRIPHTNLFLGVVNDTVRPQCVPRTSFCPCSTSDRQCLNCRRMANKDCECPCECPLRMNLCSAGRLLHDKDENNPSCRLRGAEGSPTATSWPSLRGVRLPVCDAAPRSCHMHRTKERCIGLVGCEWCEEKPAASSPDAQPRRQFERLAFPHCAPQNICFGGVLHAPSPYSASEPVSSVDSLDIQLGYIGDPLDGPTKQRLSVDTLGGSANTMLGGSATPVGPVAGAVMGAFILLALGVYCYRHRLTVVHGTVGGAGPPYHLHSAGGSDCGQLGPAHMHGDNDMDGDLDIIGLAQFESNPAGISPYRVSTGYRRPHITDSSDHGYSTMTDGCGRVSGDATSTQGGTSTVNWPQGGGAAGSVISEPDSGVAEAPPLLPPPPLCMQSALVGRHTLLQLIATDEDVVAEAAENTEEDFMQGDTTSILLQENHSSRPLLVVQGIQIHRVESAC